MALKPHSFRIGRVATAACIEVPSLYRRPFFVSSSWGPVVGVSESAAGLRPNGFFDASSLLAASHTGV